MYEFCIQFTMKAKDWQKTTHMVWERQSQSAILDTTELSSLSLSQLFMDLSGPPMVIQGIDAPLSTSTPVQATISNQQATEVIQEELHTDKYYLIYHSSHYTHH